jgi:hypothetical protein
LFVRTIIVGAAMLALPPPAIVIDARDRNRSAIGIDAYGASAIFEGVLRLSGGAYEHKRG